MEEWNDELKAKFLFYVSGKAYIILFLINKFLYIIRKGSFKLPYGGFKMLKIILT